MAKEYEITKTKATLYLKDGTKEEYDLTNAEQKKKFETKYGRIYQTGAGAPVSFISGSQGVTSITTPAPSTAASGVNVINPNGNIITGGEDIIIVITPATTKEELNALIQQMKAKGVELKFDNMDFNDGKLVSLSGSMKKKDSHSNFTVTDFVKLTLAMKEDDGKIWLKVSTRDEKVVI